MLPRADLQPSGRAVVQFANYRKASEAVDALRGKTSPGIVEDYLEARTVYMDKPPYAEMLNHRAPLATRAAAYLAYNSEGAPNLKAGLGFSGRAVMLSGFPATIPPSAILERLHKEDFYPMAGPGMSMDGPLMQEIVHLKRSVHPASLTEKKADNDDTAAYKIETPSS